MYPSILSFETINKLKLFFECGIPRPQDVGHLRLRYCNFLTHFIISIAVLENVPPDAGLQKRATFSTLNVGLAGTGNRTRATCMASSSAIHYASLNNAYLYTICGDCITQLLTYSEDPPSLFLLPRCCIFTLSPVGPGGPGSPRFPLFPRLPRINFCCESSNLVRSSAGPTGPLRPGFPGIPGSPNEPCRKQMKI
jgi:hypothetical protein